MSAKEIERLLDIIDQQTSDIPEQIALTIFEDICPK